MTIRQALLSLTLVLLFGSLRSATATEPSELFEPVPVEGDATLASLKRVLGRGIWAQVVNVRFSEFVRHERRSFPAVLTLRKKRLSLSLAPTKCYSPDSLAFRGKIAGNPLSRVVFVIKRSARRARDGSVMQRMIVGGIVQFGRYTFSISPLADETDRHVIRLLDHRNIRCSTRSVQAKALKVKTIGKTGAAPAALGPIQIDVAFFFTSFTSSDAGGDDKATLAIEVAICNLNISLEESLPSPLKKVQIHPVCIQRIDDGEEHPDCSLENLAMLEDPADGEWDDVHAVRKQKAADLVCLITYHGGSAANVMTTPSISFRDKAFSVVQLSELPMNVLAHEIGHNLGCCHQKGAAAGTSCLGHTVSTAKCLTHAHAFVNPTSNDASIVAAGGNRLPFFSNPNVTPGGQPLGDTATAYNAKVISDNATLVSSFY